MDSFSSRQVQDEAFSPASLSVGKSPSTAALKYSIPFFGCNANYSRMTDWWYQCGRCCYYRGCKFSPSLCPLNLFFRAVFVDLSPCVSGWVHLHTYADQLYYSTTSHWPDGKAMCKAGWSSQSRSVYMSEKNPRILRTDRQILLTA